MYSESERSASSAMRRRRSSRSCSTHTRMASVFFSGTDAMVVKKAGITHGHRSASVRLWRCRAITTGRVRFVRQTGEPDRGQLARGACAPKGNCGQVYGGGHVTSLSARRLFHCASKAAWSLSTVRILGFITCPCAIFRSVEIGTPDFCARIGQ